DDAVDQRHVPGRRDDSPHLGGAREKNARVSRGARRRRPDARLRVQAAERAAWLVAVLADVPARGEPRQLPSRTGHHHASSAWREATEVNGYDRVLQIAVGRTAMRHLSRSVIFVLGLAALAVPSWSAHPAAAPAAAPTIEQFLSPGYPTEIVSAKKADRIAWTAYEHGRRNVYTASAPQFHALRVTNAMKDDGIELSDLSISDDGAIVVFVRGTQPNREGWVANSTANPEGAT